MRYSRQHFITILSVLLVGGLAAGPAEARGRRLNVVQKITHREANGITKVIIQGSRTPTFTVYKLERPRRLIVDLANTTVKGYEDPLEVETWAVGLITVSRFIDARAVIARVVIGFRRAATYQVKAVGTRVVVVVTPTSTPPPAAPSAGSDPAIAKMRAEATRLKAAALARQREAERMARQARAELTRAKNLAGGTRRAALSAAHRKQAEAKQRLQQAEALRLRSVAQVRAAQRKAAETRQRALAYAERLKGEAQSLRGRARAQQLAASRLAEQARVALLRARKQAHRTRHHAEAEAQRLAAYAQQLKQKAAHTLQAAKQREQQLQQLLAAARKQLASAQAQATATRRRAQALEKAARARASQTRRQALAQAQALEKAAQARAEATRQQAEALAAAARSKASQAWRQALARAKALEQAARQQAERAREQALAQARALEQAAQRKAAAQLRAARGRLQSAHQQATRLRAQAAQARKAVSTANGQVEAAKKEAAEAKSAAESARVQADAARMEAARLLAEARRYERGVKHHAARLARTARAKARRAQILARKRARAAALARKRARTAARREARALGSSRRAQRQAAAARKAAESAQAQAQAAREEMTALKARAERYRKIAGRVRREVATLRRARAEARHDLSRLKAQAKAARTRLQRARKLATQARQEAAVNQRRVKQNLRVQAALKQAQSALKRARADLAAAKDSRRREEAKRALARAARRQAELQLRQLRLARSRVVSSKKRLEQRLVALAARHRAEREARRLEQRRRKALQRAVRLARKRRHRAERLAQRERERMEALAKARVKLQVLTGGLRKAVAEQLAQKKEIEAGLARIRRLRADGRAAARAELARLQHKVTRLQRRERRQGRHLVAMRQALRSARKRTDKRSEDLSAARNLAEKARKERSVAQAQADQARSELTAARAALAAEKAAVRRMRGERRALARALKKAERSLQGAKQAVADLKSSRAAQERALARVQKRLRREQAELERVKSRMDRELAQTDTQRRKAAARLVELQRRVAAMNRQAAAAQAARDRVRQELAVTRAVHAHAGDRELDRKRAALAARLSSLQKKEQALKRRLRRKQQATQRAEARLAAKLRTARKRTAARLRAEQARLARARKRASARLRAEQARLARARKQVAAKLAAEKRRLAQRLQTLKKRRAHRRPARIRAGVTRVHFVDGIWAHRVVIDVKGPVAHTLARATKRAFTVRLPTTTIPRRLERSLDVSEFDGPVRLVSSLRSPAHPGAVDVVVDLRHSAKYRVSRAPGKLYIDVWKTKPEVARARARRGVAPRRTPRRLDVAAARVAAYSAPVGPGASRRKLRSYRRYRYGLGGHYSGPRVDMDFNNADVHNVLRLIGRVWNKNIVVAGKVNGKVTIRLKRVRVDRALEVILKSLGLGMVWHSANLIRISPQQVINKEIADIQAAEKQRREVEPVYTRVIPLNFALAAEMEKRIKKNMLSKRGAVSADKRTNTVIVRDVSANIRAILALVRALDSATPQVLVEARIVEARSTFLREIGVQWGGNVLASQATGYPTGILFPNSVGLSGGAVDQDTVVSGLQGASQTNPNFAVNLPAAVGSGAGGALGLNLGSVTGAFNINLRLSAMEETGQVRIVSSPKITVLDNVEARIEQGVKIPISVVSAQGVSTKFEDAKLSLKVKPHVTNDGHVIMKLEVTKSEPDFVNTGARGDPTILDKTAQTEMMIKDGDTAVIGGIYTRTTSKNWSKVPWFAEIPIIGWLFKNKKEADDRSEVLIFITPRIITPRRTGSMGSKEVSK